MDKSWGRGEGMVREWQGVRVGEGGKVGLGKGRRG